MSWVRVTIKDPCPICRRPDWCTVSPEFHVACCMRVESGRALKNGGWSHRLGEDGPKLRPLLRAAPPAAPPINAADLMNQFADGTTDAMKHELAERLGVSVLSLVALGCAWAAPHRAWAFPMKDGDGNIIGIRLRNDIGRKWAVTGSRAGLFYCAGPTDTAVHICEGPTDTAAGITIGLNAIGRAACLGGESDVVQLVKRWGVRRVVIVADNDGPGFRGSRKLQVSLPVLSVIITLPVKDMREYVRLGGNEITLDAITRSMVWTQPT